jgi:hypothetical protein
VATAPTATATRTLTPTPRPLDYSAYAYKETNSSDTSGRDVDISVRINVFYADTGEPASGVSFTITINDDDPISPTRSYNVTSDGSGRANLCIGDLYDVRTTIGVTARSPGNPGIDGARIVTVNPNPASC